MITGGIITAVKKDPKKKFYYRIDINEEYAFDVHEDIFIKYQLTKGKEIDNNFYVEVLQAEEENKAYLSAIRYLGYRPRTAYQLEQYLIDKEFSPGLAEKVTERCTKQGYINDQQFAEKWIEERLRLKPRGSYMLRMELKQKGISSHIIDRALGEVEFEEEVEAARTLLRAKIAKLRGEFDPKIEQKTLQFLIRKGFSHSIVQKLRNEWRSGQLPGEID
ncbi:regulatory protein RecX [Brevibacillus daliensis]|uniref:regulatory protein RecX n=1 Tax=Brevibacillus daliensis TaxID=2892995 RepID=UPI002102D2BD|nr:RecX family transcriptional regulator [Brevibacillus daliensis]